MDAFPPLSQPKALLRPLRGLCKLSGTLWIIWPRPAVREVQGIPERGIGAFPARGCDVQRPPAAKLHARRHEVKLCSPALGVTVAHPCDVILLPIEAREGQSLEHVHALLLLFLGGGILGREGQDAVGVGPLALDAVDQFAGAVHVPPDHFGWGMIAAFRARQILRNLTPAPTPAARELNQHRRTSRARHGSKQARGQSRSSGSAGRCFRGAGGDWLHGQAG